MTDTERSHRPHRPRPMETAVCEWTDEDGTVCGVEFQRRRAVRPTVLCDPHRRAQENRTRRAWKRNHPESVARSMRSYRDRKRRQR